MATDQRSIRAAWVNGEPVEYVSAWDKSLELGDGVFETMAVVGGEILSWDRHLARLRLGCETLGIECPEPTLLNEEIDFALTGQIKAVLKFIVARATQGPDAAVLRMMLRREYPDYSGKPDGLVLRVCAHRLASQPALAGLKHLNRHDLDIARAEWDAPEIDDGLVLNTAGQVVETTKANVFAIYADNVLTTPEFKDCGVAGTMRGQVLDVAKELGLQLDRSAQDWRPEALIDAKELFICNAIMGVRPVRELVGLARYAAPGPFTTRLMARCNPFS